MCKLTTVRATIEVAGNMKEGLERGETVGTWEPWRCVLCFNPEKSVETL